jgi:hypothetical protein
VPGSRKSTDALAMTHTSKHARVSIIKAPKQSEPGWNPWPS